MFIVFEGIDGCGKSTQIWKFSKYLSELNKYNHIIVTRESYKNLEIRKILKSDEKPEKQKEKLTQLFVNDRKNHIDKLIKPNLEKGIFVLSDRYKYSTIAYQSAQGQDIDELINLHKNMLIPDLVFIFDVSMENSIKRMKKDFREEHKFEKNKEFLSKVKENYLKMPEIFPDENIVIINSNKTVEEIFEKIKEHFSKFKNI